MASVATEDAASVAGLAASVLDSSIAMVGRLSLLHGKSERRASGDIRRVGAKLCKSLLDPFDRGRSEFILLGCISCHLKGRCWPGPVY